MLFEKVNKEHIIQGITDYEEKGLPNEFGPSSTYDVIFQDKKYPPKAIMAYANYHAEGRKIERYFKGGLGTDCFNAFERNGFKVIRKIDPIKSIISRYKRYISISKLKDESYKWELLSEYRGKPNLNAQNLLEELKNIDYSNLLYAMSKAVLKHLITEKPEEIRSLFKMLFDESIELKARVKRFNEETLTLYRGIGETLQHHQDERTIATYLTFNNPDKYTFYKYSFYKKYCKLLGIKQAKKNEKYIHYLALINELIENYIKTDQELINQVKDCIPEYYNGKKHLLLAQDILYQMLEKDDVVNYWIFQGNPNIYDITSALNAGHLKSWKVAAHRDKIQIGDQVILWQTGDNSGCYALAEVTSEVKVFEEETNEQQYYTEGSNTNAIERVKIKIIKNLVEDPILWSDIKNNPIFSEFKAGNQGTNFSATETEYNELLTYENQQNSFFDVKAKFKEPIFNNYIKNLKHIVSELHLDINDERVVFSVRNDRLNFIIGQRYAFNLYLNEKKGSYGVISISKLTEDSEPFGGKNREVLYTYLNDFEPNENEWTSILNGMSFELKRTNKSSYSKHNSIDFQNYIFDMKEVQKNKEVVKSLNQIFYGPPGTGKTYNTILEAAKIIEQDDSLEYVEAQEVFNNGLGDRIEFITFHQNYSYEDFIQGLRPDTELSGELSFFKSDGVFKRIADRALKNLKESKNPESAKKEFEVVFNELTKPLNEGDVDELVIKMKQTSFYITEIGEKSIEFRKNQGDSKHTLSINTLRKMYDSGANNIILGGLQPYYNPILNLLLENGKRHTESVKEQNYVIIIDEINRANISRVFGELITLIEKDKRFGGAIPLTATLPSGEKFIVPSNLYIIGTMNTADKSIALLDIALRRRFEFVAMYPKYELENSDLEINDTEILKKLNKEIISRKGYDFTIGHSYFMGEDYNLKNTIDTKVIPLLLEYFMNDFEEVKKILQAAGLVIDGWPMQLVKND